jgi:trigger factor
MKVSVSEKSPVLIEIAVELPWAQVEAAMNEAYASVGKKARIRGFRPGKAPRKLLEQQFGRDVTQDVGSRLVRESLLLAIEQRKLRPVSSPQVEPSRMEPGTPFKFKAVLEVRPKISELTVDGLTGKRPPLAVPDADVDGELEALRRAHGALKTIDPPRPVQLGDVLKVDYQVSVEGVARPDMGGAGRVVELGRGDLLSTFEEALVGAQVGETRTAEHTFDEGSSHPQLRGKQAAFTITVHQAQELVLPTLDDELAKDVGEEYETLADLKKAIRERLEERKKQEVERAVRDSVIADFSEKNPIPVPPSMVEDHLEYMERTLLSQVTKDPRGMRLSDEVRTRLREQAEAKVRAGLLITELARQRNITAKDEDLDKRIEEIAERSGKHIAKVRADFSNPDRMEALKAQIVEEKALDLLVRKATITDVAATEPEASAAV